MMNLTQLLPIAVSAAQAAGDLIKCHYRSACNAWDKSPDNPVTKADLAANQLLHEWLTAATPDCGWLSEETADTLERLDKNRIWIVDPLDGTKEFIEGLDEFAVSVAFVQDGRPLLGVVHNPAKGETTAGIVGQGLTYNGEAAKKLSGRAETSGARVLVSDTEVRRGMWAPYQDARDLKQVGSAAYKLGRVAAGFGDAYITLKPKHEWDICAGVALVLAAGGRATDLSGRTFRFNQVETEVNGVVAANSTLHAALIGLLERRGTVNDSTIRLDKEMGTLLIPLSREDFGLSDENAECRGMVFEPKEEVHITVIGKDLGRKLKEAVKGNPLIESQIEQTIEETKWSYKVKDQMYRVSKDKKKDNPQGGFEVVHTESIIRMVEVMGIQHFYEKLGRILQMKLEVPPTHVTLYTHGDPFGIGLATRADFEEFVAGEILPNELKRLPP